MKNAINWFEIPAKDFDRAIGFYKKVLQVEMQIMQMDPTGAKWAFFHSTWRMAELEVAL